MVDETMDAHSTPMAIAPLPEQEGPTPVYMSRAAMAPHLLATLTSCGRLALHRHPATGSPEPERRQTR